MFANLILFVDGSQGDVLTYEEFWSDIWNNKCNSSNTVETSFHVADDSLELDLSWDKSESNWKING